MRHLHSTISGNSFHRKLPMLTLSRLPTLSIVACTTVLFFALTTATALARGRSFLREATGVVTEVSNNGPLFTFAVDEPAEVLSLAVGRDCKFSHAGRATPAAVLRKGMRAKISYYSTIFTGKIALEIDADPVPKVENGIIESVEPAARKLSIRSIDASRSHSFRWAPAVRITQSGRRVSSRALTVQRRVTISYFDPDFGRKYIVEIRIQPGS